MSHFTQSVTNICHAVLHRVTLSVTEGSFLIGRDQSPILVRPSKTKERQIATIQINNQSLFSAELWPVCQTGNAEETDAKTREFLRAVVEILLDHITVQNDRTAKILDFHSPDQLKEVIDFAIPDEPLNLDQLLVDCKDTLKYQVKTGMNS